MQGSHSFLIFCHKSLHFTTLAVHIHPCSFLALICCTIPLPFLCLPCAQYPFTSLHSLIHHLLTFPPMPCIITLVPSIISDFMHHYIESLHSIATPFLVPSIISDFMHHCTQLLHHSMFPSIAMHFLYKRKCV